MKSLKSARSLGPVVSSVEVVGLNIKLVRCVASAANPDGILRVVQVLWNALDAKGKPLDNVQSATADLADSKTLLAHFFSPDIFAEAETLLLASIDTPTTPA